MGDIGAVVPCIGDNGACDIGDAGCDTGDTGCDIADNGACDTGCGESVRRIALEG